HSHIFTVRAPDDPFDKPIPTQITDGDFDEGGLTWAPDGSNIFFLSRSVAEPYYTEAGAELYSTPVAGGSITKVAAIDGSIGSTSVSPAGKRIEFRGSLR